MMELSMHDCRSVRIDSHSPDNANSIRLQVVRADWRGNEETFDLTMYGLPKAVTDKLMAAFADENTQRLGFALPLTKEREAANV